MKNRLTKAELVAFIEELCEELECDWRQLGCIANPDVLYGDTDADRPEREAFYVGARSKAMQVSHKIRTTLAGKQEDWHPMAMAAHRRFRELGHPILRDKKEPK